MAGDRLTDLPCFFVWAALRRPEPRGITLACDKVEQDGVSLPEHAWCPVCRARASRALSGTKGEGTAYVCACGGLTGTPPRTQRHHTRTRCWDTNVDTHEWKVLAFAPAARSPEPAPRCVCGHARIDHAAKVWDDMHGVAITVRQDMDGGSCVEILTETDKDREHWGRVELMMPTRAARLLATALLQISDYADASAKGDPSDAV